MTSLTSPRRLFLATLLTLSMASGHAEQLDQQIETIASDARFFPERALTELQRLELQMLDAGPGTRAEFLHQRGYAQLLVGQHDKALADAAELLELAQTTHDPAIKARALLLRGTVLVKQGQVDEGRRLIWEGARLAAGGPPLLHLRAQIAAGQAWGEDGQFDKALPTLLAAVDSAQQQQAPRFAIRGLQVLANLYDAARDPAKGMEALDQAVALATRTHAEADLAVLRLTEFSLATQNGQWARARRALELTLEWARHNGAPEVAAVAGINLAGILLEHFKEPRRALEYADEALAFLQRTNGNAQMASPAYLNRIRALLMLGRREEARRDFESAFRAMSARGDKPELLTDLDEYASALEETGDYRGAIAALRRKLEVSEELFSEQRTKALLKLQKEYDQSKQQAKIELLRHDNQAQLAELEHRRRTQLIWALFAVAGVAASALLGVLYRKMRRAHALLHKTNEQLSHLSQRDHLTSLYNRRHFQQFMASLQQHDRRSAYEIVNSNVQALFLLDVDHFKRINDSYGHAAGDAVLKMVAERLRQIVRETDMIVRWGGEEFLVCVPGLPPDRLEDVAQRILNGMAAHPVEFEGNQIEVQVSLGYAQLELLPAPDSLTWERTLALADDALYLAKNNGRNRAYGLRSIVDAQPSTLRRVEQNLDGAWHEGLVDLALVVGH